MKLTKTLLVSSAIAFGSTFAALAQAPSTPPGNQNKSPNMTPPGTELPAPNTGVQTPNQKQINSGSRPIGPPANETVTNPNNPGANLKKLDKEGKGGQQQ